MFLENLGVSNTGNTDLLVARRKTPRCVLAMAALGDQFPLIGVKALWEDRTETELLDLNLSGAVLAREGTLARNLMKAKKGQVFQLTLKFEALPGQTLSRDLERQALMVRIIDLNAETVSVMFDSISAGGRLHLPQEMKDLLVLRNWQRQVPSRLELQYQNSYWFHAPFDTNLVVTSESSGLIEYDGLLLKWSPQGDFLYKAPSAGTEKEIYSNLWTQPPSTKVAAGSSWQDRWLGLIQIVMNETRDPQTRQILTQSYEAVKTRT